MRPKLNESSLQNSPSTKKLVELSLGTCLHHLINIAFFLSELQLVHSDLLVRQLNQTLAIENLVRMLAKCNRRALKVCPPNLSCDAEASFGICFATLRSPTQLSVRIKLTLSR
jgi:hypothetical protein